MDDVEQFGISGEQVLLTGSHVRQHAAQLGLDVRAFARNPDPNDESDHRTSFSAIRVAAGLRAGFAWASEHAVSGRKRRRLDTQLSHPGTVGEVGPARVAMAPSGDECAYQPQMCVFVVGIVRE